MYDAHPDCCRKEPRDAADDADVRSGIDGHHWPGVRGSSWGAAAAQGLEPRVTTLESEVASLQSTVNTLTAEVTTLGQPDSATVVFAYNHPVSFTTLPVNIGTGWTKMTVSVGMSYGGSITEYALRIPVVPGVITQDPTDNINWMEQIRVACDGGVGCPVIAIPVISEFYEFSTGTSSGNVTAAAVVEK
jgi:hypothetical protein